jgi:YVTN family beta-propeller protein
MTRVVVALLVLLTGAAPPAQSPGSRLLVLNKTDATLSIIDPLSGTTTAVVPTGPDPHEVTTSADGRLAIATSYSGNALSVVDIAARRETQRVALPDLRQPHGIETVGGIAVFTAEGNRALAGYDPAANRIAWRMATEQDGTHMVTASRDGRTLFLSNLGSNTHIPVGSGPEGLDLSPDGRELWTAHSGDGDVSVIDVGAKKVVHRINAKTKRSNRLKFTRDGRYALISDLDAGELVVVDAKTRAIARRLRLGSMPEGILIPPAGDRVYVAVTGENRVVAIDVNTLTIVQTIQTGRGPDGMAWAAAR